MATIGRFNSSITRVSPFFAQLLRRDPTGRRWLPGLLSACPHADRLPAPVRADPGPLWEELAITRRYRDRILGPIDLEGAFEHGVPPPERFLRHLLTHPEQLRWPMDRGGRRRFSAHTEQLRRALLDGPPEATAQAVEEGLAALDRVGARGANARPWWSFEGFTEVDCFLETDELVLFIEGKRTDVLANSTDWFPGRHQLIRNLEAVGEIAGGRAGGVLLVTEETVPELDADAYAQGLPHLSPTEREEVAGRYLGQTTWLALCQALDVPFSSLPDERASIPAVPTAPKLAAPAPSSTPPAERGDAQREGRDPLAFLPGVAEKLGHYVYALIDPRDERIFYVGKGSGDRVYQHARRARKVGPQTRSELKLGRIHEIHGEGLEVRVEVIRHRLEESAAFEVEAAVLDTLELAGLESTNLVSGHGAGRGWRPLSDIVASYVATPVEIPPEHRVLLVRVSRMYRRGFSAEELYDKTRQWWKVNPKRRADYAFSVYEGIVRAVYRIGPWHPYPADLQVGRMKGRWAFEGASDPAMEERYLWKDVSSYLALGAQNPIKYVNC